MLAGGIITEHGEGLRMTELRALADDAGSVDDGSGRNPFEESLGQLVSRIRSGDLPMGSRLPPERELSNEMQVGRSTLRAVIRALQQAGYIETRRGRTGGSTVIWEPDGDERGQRRLSDQMKERLLDALRFRSVLEPGAAALAAERHLTEAELQGLDHRLEAATCGGPDFRLADSELHTYIAELSNCRALADQVANIQLILNENLLQVVPFFGPALEHSHEQHAQIVAAIRASDRNLARQLMETHVNATSELLSGFL